MAQDVKTLVLQALTEQITEANKHAENYSAATQDSGKVVHEIRASSEDEKVAAFREWLDKANAAIENKTAEIDEYIKANLVAAAKGDVNPDAEKEAYTALKDEINAARKYLKTLGVSEDDMGNLPDLKTLRGGTAKSGAGAGGKRPRLSEVTVDGERVFATKKNDDGTVTESASFTVTAQHLSKVTGAKVQPKDLQQAAFAAAGTDDLSTKAGQPIEFYFESGEGDKRKNFQIVVTPRDADAASE